MVDYDTLKSAFQELGLASNPVIAHASLKPFGYIQKGADAVLQALSASVQSVIMPTFTYRTMITPEVGPPDNGISYGSDEYYNREARAFTMEMPANSMMGILPETLRSHPLAKRTSHPILSFAGVGAERILETQTLQEPFAPIGVLAEEDGWVVLINVDHTVNTSIHYAETRGKKNVCPLGTAQGSGGGMSQLPGQLVGLQRYYETYPTEYSPRGS